MLPSVFAAAAAPKTPSLPCADAIETLFGIGSAFLWTALGFAVIAALAALYQSLRTPPAAAPVGPQAIVDPTAFVDAVLKLIEGLAKAPAWLAMFACGALLFWMGSAMSDGRCGNAADAPRAGAADAATQRGKPAPAPTASGAAGAASDDGK